MTLQDLANATSLSVAYLSNVEREATSPTINNLLKISEALHVDITEVLSNTPLSKVVVRKDERKEVFQTNSKLKYELITEGTQSIKGVCITLPPDFSDEVISYGHQRDELGVVTSGTLSMTLDTQEYILHPGDSIFIASGTAHKYHKIGDGECISYWAFVYGGNPVSDAQILERDTMGEGDALNIRSVKI